LFPEFAAAARWTDVGRGALEQQCRSLIDDDGAFSQHSMNYQRVMLHACLWAIRLGELHAQPLSNELQERVGRAGTFLWQAQDERTGRVPRYGANDGALVLPLTNCDSQDFRPVIQAVEYVRNRKRRFNGGPWDEETLWLFGAEALRAEANDERRCDWQAANGGYRVLRSQGGHVFTRAGSYRHRPSHADMLHVDVWWRGQNIALDPGTYTYNAPPPWDSPLARTVFHNTVTVDRLDQMDRAGRFLWLPWVGGQQSQNITSANGHLTYWEGTHDGYERLPSPVSYRRGILRISVDHWLIVDSLRSNVPHSYRLHWLLTDVPYVFNEERQHLRLQTDAGPYDVRIASTADYSSSCVRADPLGPRGWYAPVYGDRQPALSWACVAEAPAVTFWTLLGPSTAELRCEANELHAETDAWTCCVLGGNALGANNSIIRAATITGTPTDSLCVNSATNSRSMSKSVSSS
ncbi:MAG: heparinase II/III-family protein, partial [Planctomycetaceae bacterium]